MILEVKIIPNSSQNEILRWEGSRLVIKIKGIPENGIANKNLIEFLAKILKIRKSQIKIISGETSRIKKLNLEEISLNEINAVLK